MEDPIEALVSSFADAIGVPEFSLWLSFCWFGALSLAFSFHRGESAFASYSAAIGWSLLGLFFYMQSAHFVEIGDPLLVIMTAGALPAGIVLGIWEIRNWEMKDESMVWLRGAVAWSVIPYYVVYSIPFLNMEFVEMTARSTEWLLEFTGLGSFEVGEMMVDLPEGAIAVSQWEGSRYFLTEPLGESGFFIPFNHSDGTPVSVSFILACSALQSMIIFVGAIVALSSVSWKRRARGLLIAIPTIHVLNVFRNAGIVWLSDTYPNWRLYSGSEIDMFDFTHSYAAKVASLFAMFLMATALFDLLPELHRHIIRITKPLTNLFTKSKAESAGS